MTTSRVNELRESLGTSAGFFLLAAIALVLYGAYIWLKVGSWPLITADSIRASLKMAPIQTAWVGVQDIIDYLMSVQLWLDCGVLSVALGWAALSLAKGR